MEILTLSADRCQSTYREPVSDAESREPENCALYKVSPDARILLKEVGRKRRAIMAAIAKVGVYQRMVVIAKKSRYLTIQSKLPTGAYYTVRTSDRTRKFARNARHLQLLSGRCRH